MNFDVYLLNLCVDRGLEMGWFLPKRLKDQYFSEFCIRPGQEAKYGEKCEALYYEILHLSFHFAFGEVIYWHSILLHLQTMFFPHCEIPSRVLENKNI
jgi:hypothetical protein